MKIIIYILYDKVFNKKIVFNEEPLEKLRYMSTVSGPSLIFLAVDLIQHATSLECIS